jgi:hypothetical protein
MVITCIYLSKKKKIGNHMQLSLFFFCKICMVLLKRFGREERERFFKSLWGARVPLDPVVLSLLGTLVPHFQGLS